jgi:hypothetical protein
VRDDAALSQEAAIINASPRESIAATDINGNGTPDWEEYLAENIFKTIEVPPVLSATSTGYTPPTTLTGRFSEAFLQDYLQGKMGGKDFSDPSAFLNDAIAAIENNAKSKRHNATDVLTIPTTKETAHTYGNTLQEIIAVHSTKSENELVILGRALEAKNPELLEPLTIIAEGYANIIADTALTPVPDRFIAEHVALLNAYEAILADIRAAQAAFTDPLLTLARVRDYELHVQDLFAALKGVGRALDREGVIYTSDEPGAFYRILETL